MGQTVTFGTPSFSDPNIVFPASGLPTDFRAYITVRGPGISLDLEEGVRPIHLLGTDVQCATPMWTDGQHAIAITVYKHSGTECPDDSCTSCQEPRNEHMMVGSAQWCLTVADHVHSFAGGACTDLGDNRDGDDENGGNGGGGNGGSGNGGNGARDVTNPDDLADLLNPRSDTSDSTGASDSGVDSTDQNRRRPRDSSWRHAIPPGN